MLTGDDDHNLREGRVVAVQHIQERPSNQIIKGMSITCQACESAGVQERDACIKRTGRSWPVNSDVNWELAPPLLIASP